MKRFIGRLHERKAVIARHDDICGRDGELSFEGNPRDVDVGSILADPMGELYIRCQPIHAAAQEP